MKVQAQQGIAGGFSLHARSALLALTIASAALLAACDQERIARTQPGMSTEQEVVAQWGQPESVQIDAQGQRVLEYNRQPNGYANYRITIGADGRVVSLINILNRQTFAQIQPGMHMEQVRQILGRPATAVPYDLKGEIVYDWRWREGTGGAPYRRFEVTTDRNFIVKRTADVEEPSQSDKRR